MKNITESELIALLLAWSTLLCVATFLAVRHALKTNVRVVSQAMMDSIIAGALAQVKEARLAQEFVDSEANGNAGVFIIGSNNTVITNLRSFDHTRRLPKDGDGIDEAR